MGNGAQIGQVIGSVIGSYFGPWGQAIGAYVGPAIGGNIDPGVVNGPLLTRRDDSEVEVRPYAFWRVDESS
jgi:hypothetical protein